MKINQYIDHTYLKPFASEQDIIERKKTIIEEFWGYIIEIISPGNMFIRE